MMVVDANVLIFFHVVNPAFTPRATQAIEKASALCAPEVWRSELRSAFMRYVRVHETSEIPGSALVLDEAVAHMRDAEHVVGHTLRIPSEPVLRLAARSGCSPYDCEYVRLAVEQGTRLLTYDETVLEAFPELAVRPGDFVAEP